MDLGASKQIGIGFPQDTAKFIAMDSGWEFVYIARRMKSTNDFKRKIEV